MNIALDANEANTKTRVGTGQYTYNLLNHWSKVTGHSFDCYLRRSQQLDLPPVSDFWHYHVTGPQKAWTRLSLPFNLLLATGKYDVFWNPAHYLPPYTGCPSVVTVHDLAYEYFPDLFLDSDLYKLRRWTRLSVKSATKIIAVSESTKTDLVKLYKTDPSKIKVIYNGYDDKLFNTTSKLNKTLLARYNIQNTKYILFVSTIQPRKNVVKLVQAFRLLKEAGYSGKLVIAGKVGWMAEESLAVIKGSPDHKDIVMTGYISDETRQVLYRYADVSVLPSLYEGFGVSVLEAMASGAPTVASDNSSLPEVMGDAGIMFNPIDPADIARAIFEIKKDRSGWIKKGLKQASKFSWDKCAQETLKVITNISR